MTKILQIAQLGSAILRKKAKHSEKEYKKIIAKHKKKRKKKWGQKIPSKQISEAEYLPLWLYV